jgi:hypothetical protein
VKRLRPLKQRRPVKRLRPLKQRRPVKPLLAAKVRRAVERTLDDRAPASWEGMRDWSRNRVRTRATEGEDS